MVLLSAGLRLMAALSLLAALQWNLEVCHCDMQRSGVEQQATHHADCCAHDELAAAASDVSCGLVGQAPTASPHGCGKFGKTLLTGGSTPELQHLYHVVNVCLYAQPTQPPPALQIAPTRLVASTHHPPVPDRVVLHQSLLI